MAKNITTARGESLNMDALVAEANRPMNYRDPVAEIAPVEPPKPNLALNMRGYMPAQTTSAPPASPVSKSTVTAVEAVSNPAMEDSRTLAELTGIRIDKARTLKVRPGAKVRPGDGAAMAEDTVNRATQTMRESATDKPSTGSVLDDLDS